MKSPARAGFFVAEQTALMDKYQVCEPPLTGHLTNEPPA